MMVKKNSFVNCKLILATALTLGIALFQHAMAENWYKGELHCHSHWSDGNTLPELAIDWYRNDGFDFMSLTDHNVLQLDENRWREVDPVLVEESKQKFGDAWIESKVEDGKTLIRLKTISELQKLFNDGKFLLIPGHEQNTGVAGRTLHCNAVNISESIPFPNDFPTVMAAALSWRKAALENAEKNNHVGFWMLNHPDWPYFDVTPDMLVEAAEIEFYEWNISSPAWYDPVHPDHPSPEKYWDIINAFRLRDGNKPIYMVTADDTHDYRNFKPHGVNPGHGWVGVRAEKLDANAIFTAMKNGDFYSSTGVEMTDIRFDAKTRTLHVEAKPEEGVFYTVRFVGTKKDFDPSFKTFDDPQVGRKPGRTGKIYSGEIGETFKTVAGPVASYTMESDDLYVRAVITSSKWPQYRDRNEPQTETAWTQPVW